MKSVLSTHSEFFSMLDTPGIITIGNAQLCYILTSLPWSGGPASPSLGDAANVVDALVGSHKPHSRSCLWLQEERAIIVPRLLPPSNEPEQPGTLPSFAPSHVPTSSPAPSKPSTAYRLLKAACGPSALSLHSRRHQRNGRSWNQCC